MEWKCRHHVHRWQLPCDWQRFSMNTKLSTWWRKHISIQIFLKSIPTIPVCFLNWPVQWLYSDVDHSKFVFELLVTEFRCWWHLLLVLTAYVVSNIRRQHRCCLRNRWCWWQNITVITILSTFLLLDLNFLFDFLLRFFSSNNKW